jgi:hypothetical protein
VCVLLHLPAMIIASIVRQPNKIPTHIALELRLQKYNLSTKKVISIVNQLTNKDTFAFLLL